MPATSRIAELLDRARELRITVVGDAMLDVYLNGDVERISPEAPVPVVRVRNRSFALGGAANVAQNVTALGAHCDLIAVVGGDAPGATLHEMLRGIGAAARLTVSSRCTTQKTRIVARAQQVVRVDEEDDHDLGPEDVERLVEAVRASVGEADALILEDYNKGVLVQTTIRAAIEAASARHIPIVVDPKFRNFFAYHGATIFKPNRRELEAALGATVDLDHPEAMAGILKRLGTSELLLTLGERGMLLFHVDGGVTSIDAMDREVFDVVGAGDTVTAFLATMLAAGASSVEAAAIANIAAGLEVGKLGAVAIRPDEVLDASTSLGVRH